MKFKTSRSSDSVMESDVGTKSLEMELIKQTRLYQMQVAVKEEVLRHKWIESEKAGRDMGFEWALVDWICKHRTLWQRHRDKIIL